MKKLMFVLAVVLTACGSKKNTPQNESSVVVTESAASNADDSLKIITRPVYHASRTILTDLIHTKLEVSFDWGKSRMNGIATITAKPHFYPADSLILDAKGMDILYVKLNDQNLSYQYDSLQLKIKLNKTYTRNDSYQVKIAYVAKPDERKTGGSAAITSDKGLYFINPNGEDKLKMPQIWTQGETEANSVWFPTLDSPNFKSTEEIFITVADKYVTLSNGKLVASVKNADGTRTDHWKQDKAHAPYLFMMGIGEFKIVKDSYTRPDGSKMDVNYYVEPEWEQYAQAIFGETPEMIRYFSQLLGYEYAWDKYNQIVVRDYVSGAMENTGAVVFGDFVYKTNRELLDDNDQSTIAHELFHHWFGDLVTAESWSNLPLNESFANYSQYLWDEHRFGLDEADFQAEKEADGYFQSAQVQGYHDLIWFDYDDKEQMFDGHSYNKGGRILHMLRNYLGDEAFFAGIQKYLTVNQFKAAEYNQLRLAFEEVSGEDLNWFFNQWFLGSGHPVLNISQNEHKDKQTVTITVEQKQNLETTPLYKLPVQVAVFDDHGKHVHKIVIDQSSQEFELPYSGTLQCVIFDDQQMLLGKFRETKPTEQYIYQYYNGKRYKVRKEALQFGVKSSNVKSQQLILDALNDPFWSIRLLAIEKAVKLEEKNNYKAKGIYLIKDLVTNDSNSQVRAAALNFLANTLKPEEINAICKDRINKDQSYTVVSAALKQLSKTDSETAMKLAKNLENEASSKMLSNVAQVYASYGNEENYDFFIKLLTGNQLQGFDQLGVMSSFTYYLSRMEPAYAVKAFSVYDQLSKDGGYYTQMFIPQSANYLVENANKAIASLNEELAAYEKNKDAVYADQTRKKIALYEQIKKDYSTLKSSENTEE